MHGVVLSPRASPIRRMNEATPVIVESVSAESEQAMGTALTLVLEDRRRLFGQGTGELK
jgi:hypothetical protein